LQVKFLHFTQRPIRKKHENISLPADLRKNWTRSYVM